MSENDAQTNAETPSGNEGARSLPATWLRGHHFVCLQFFDGEGCPAAYVENLRAVVARTLTEPALLVESADDVCAACPSKAPDGSCIDPGAGEDEIRRIDALAYEVLGVRPGARLSLADARARLAADAVASGRWRFEACPGCAWGDACEEGWDDLLGEV
jgi:uncharacterized protein